MTPMVFVRWAERHTAFVAKYGEVAFKTVGRALTGDAGDAVSALDAVYGTKVGGQKEG